MPSPEPSLSAGGLGCVALREESWVPGDPRRATPAPACPGEGATHNAQRAPARTSAVRPPRAGMEEDRPPPRPLLLRGAEQGVERAAGRAAGLTEAGPGAVAAAGARRGPISSGGRAPGRGRVLQAGRARGRRGPPSWSGRGGARWPDGRTDGQTDGAAEARAHLRPARTQRSPGGGGGDYRLRSGGRSACPHPRPMGSQVSGAGSLSARPAGVSRWGRAGAGPGPLGAGARHRHWPPCAHRAPPRGGALLAAISALWLWLQRLW